MQGPDHAGRAEVGLVDAILTFFLVVAFLALAPTIYTFIDMVTGPADAFSELLLQLIPPILLITLIISVGVSARRGGG